MTRKRPPHRGSIAEAAEIVSALHRGGADALRAAEKLKLVIWPPRTRVKSYVLGTIKVRVAKNKENPCAK